MQSNSFLDRVKIYVKAGKESGGLQSRQGCKSPSQAGKRS
jgi:hypothetical protein